MSTATYSYETRLAWEGQRRGRLRAEGIPEITVTTPPEFRGEAGFWTPEHLFVAAAESCLRATFLAIAENSRLPVVAYRSEAEGRIERADGAGFRFVELTVRPVVELESAGDRERAERIMAKAAKGCLITKSMALEVRVEPELLVRIPAAA